MKLSWRKRATRRGLVTILKYTGERLDVVLHASNPSYSGDKSRRITV
jgi:hypothetical protein